MPQELENFKSYISIFSNRTRVELHSLCSRSYSATTRRHYHISKRQEILPLIAVGIVGAIGMYSLRALKRMDREWEEYEEALGFAIEKKNAEKTLEKKNPVPRMNIGVMVIDLGTLNVRISHNVNLDVTTPHVVINREGARATPNFILFDTDGSFTTGKLAGSKRYERSSSPSPVVNTGMIMRGFDDLHIDPSIRNHMVTEVIFYNAKNALEQVVGPKKILSSSLFTADSSMNGYNIKPVFTYAPIDHVGETYRLASYKEAVKPLLLSDSIASFIPEPLSAVKGAKYYGLVKDTTEPIMVIDVGAYSTSISIVRNNQVLHYAHLRGFGGETLVEALMNYIAKSFYGIGCEKVQDKMALQRLYDASKDAVIELSSGSKKNLGRTQINIPYLSVDDKMRPKHLNVGVSIKVLEAEMNELVRKTIAGEFAQKQGVLSSFHSNPYDLATLFSSMTMKVLEESGHNPFSLHSVLIVGGGARSPLIQGSIKNGIASISGEQFVQDKFVIPRDELIEELTVLGAASALID